MADITVTITVDDDSTAEVVDAVNEVLNVLAVDGHIDDSDDNGWSWSGI